MPLPLSGPDVHTVPANVVVLGADNILQKQPATVSTLPVAPSSLPLSKPVGVGLVPQKVFVRQSKWSLLSCQLGPLPLSPLLTDLLAECSQHISFGILCWYSDVDFSCD